MRARLPQQRIVIPRSTRSGRKDFQLALQGAFQLSAGAIPLVLQRNAQRLLAFLALSGRTVSRDATAGALWPDASEARAHASLRSAISRLDEITRESVEVDYLDLRLAEGVTVDLRDSRALAHRLLILDTAPSASDMSSEAIAALSSELLPDWYDDWVSLEAEEWRQLRLHALEALARALAATGRYGDAIESALSAIRAEPLRESATAVLIRIHLAEGNRSEAIRAFERYRAELRAELAIEPTPALFALIGRHPPLERG
jgi:DNA-binding SARP family transcriptional activator